MNESDKSLSSFFYDINNIERYLMSGAKPTKYHQACEKILKEKSYTDINIQDEKGNTYLHYLSHEGNWNWFIRLLKEGADPTIKNNDGRNAFQVCKKYDGIHNFWRLSSNRELERFSEDWNDKTKGFCKNYKQFLFDNNLNENSHNFEKIESALEFLEKSQIDSTMNRIALVAHSFRIQTIDKKDWFEANYGSKEESSQFLSHLVTRASLFKKDITDLMVYFMQKDLAQTKNMNKIAGVIIVDNSNYGKEDNLCRELFRSMIKNKFDFTQESGFYTGETLYQLIQKSAPNHAMFLEEELNNNPTKNKRIKI